MALFVIDIGIVNVVNLLVIEYGMSLLRHNFVGWNWWCWCYMALTLVLWVVERRIKAAKIWIYTYIMILPLRFHSHRLSECWIRAQRPVHGLWDFNVSQPPNICKTSKISKAKITKNICKNRKNTKKCKQNPKNSTLTQIIQQNKTHNNIINSIIHLLSFFHGGTWSANWSTNITNTIAINIGDVAATPHCNVLLLLSFLLASFFFSFEAIAEQF